MTTWDPDTLEQDTGIYQKIRSRFGGRLALNAWAGREGRIELGEDVELLEDEVEVDVDVPLVGRYV
jgi:hypothetical protein